MPTEADHNRWAKKLAKEALLYFKQEPNERGIRVLGGDELPAWFQPIAESVEDGSFGDFFLYTAISRMADNPSSYAATQAMAERAFSIYELIDRWHDNDDFKINMDYACRNGGYGFRGILAIALRRQSEFVGGDIRMRIFNEAYKRAAIEATQKETEES